MKTMQIMIQESLAVLLRGEGRVGLQQFYPAAVPEPQSDMRDTTRPTPLKQLKLECMNLTKR